MSRIKRTFTSLFYKVDQVVGEIENHDALIQVAIREHQTKLNAARVECNRVTSRYHQIEKETKQLAGKQAEWESRAISETNQNPQDKERALACLQRAEVLAEKIARMKITATEYLKASERMAAEIKDGTQALDELKQKHQFMRARQATADALGKYGDVGSTRSEDVQASFDRWEGKIGPVEIEANHELGDFDELEREYVNQENRQKLEDRLNQLLSKDNPKGEQ